MGLPENWRRILEIAGFTETYPNLDLSSWIRHVSDGSVVKFAPQSGGGRFNLEPSIGDHSQENHLLHAAAAAIQFKTAMTLAETCGGRLLQSALVGACRLETGSGERVVAQYPEQPLQWSSLCAGFRDVLSKGVRQ